MNEINRYKIHRVVEFIKYKDVYGFEFTCDDVESNLYEILRYYGVYDLLTPEEEKLVKKELVKLAKQFEIREAMLLVPNPEKEFFVGIRPTIVEKYRR